MVKTSAVPDNLKNFSGKAKVFNNEDECYEAYHKNELKEGDAIVIRYEGPKGGPGMQEMLYPTSYLKSMKLDKQCALLTDGRFSGGTAGAAIGHVSPEAAEGGPIAFIEEGDIIAIDIPNRKLELRVSDEVLAKRKEGWTPKKVDTFPNSYLKRYAHLVTSASTGATMRDDF